MSKSGDISRPITSCHFSREIIRLLALRRQVGAAAHFFESLKKSVSQGLALCEEVGNGQLDGLIGARPHPSFRNRDDALAAVCERFQHTVAVCVSGQPETLYECLAGNRAFHFALMVGQVEYDRASAWRHTRSQINNVHGKPRQIRLRRPINCVADFQIYQNRSNENQRRC
jgi:hypothetical protein